MGHDIRFALGLHKAWRLILFGGSQRPLSSLRASIHQRQRYLALGSGPASLTQAPTITPCSFPVSTCPR
jgi:hypothetical protein